MARNVQKHIYEHWGDIKLGNLNNSYLLRIPKMDYNFSSSQLSSFNLLLHFTSEEEKDVHTFNLNFFKNIYPELLKVKMGKPQNYC